MVALFLHVHSDPIHKRWIYFDSNGYFLHVHSDPIHKCWIYVDFNGYFLHVHSDPIHKLWFYGDPQMQMDKPCSIEPAFIWHEFSSDSTLALLSTYEDNV